MRPIALVGADCNMWAMHAMRLSECGIHPYDNPIFQEFDSMCKYVLTFIRHGVVGWCVSRGVSVQHCILRMEHRLGVNTRRMCINEVLRCYGIPENVPGSSRSSAPHPC